MKFIKPILLLLIAIAWVSPTLAQAEAPKQILFTNVNVWTVAAKSCPWVRTYWSKAT